MRVHHLNCGTFHPRVPGRLLGVHGAPRSVCHCLLVETEAGLVLVDTGLGERDVADPKRLGAVFLHVARPSLAPFETAVRQIERLGFQREDVTTRSARHGVGFRV